jgi:hypothetical protein
VKTPADIFTKPNPDVVDRREEGDPLIAQLHGFAGDIASVKAIYELVKREGNDGDVSEFQDWLRGLAAGWVFVSAPEVEEARRRRDRVIVAQHAASGGPVMLDETVVTVAPGAVGPAPPGEGRGRGVVGVVFLLGAGVWLAGRGKRAPRA